MIWLPYSKRVQSGSEQATHRLFLRFALSFAFVFSTYFHSPVIVFSCVFRTRVL